MENWQRQLEEHFSADLAPTAPFAKKKELTSAFRRIAPDGLATSIMMTANIRALRHVINMRTHIAAEEEIRVVYDQIAELCKERYPNFFQDCERQEDESWLVKYNA
jgi:thymidylate synthase (FAD)